MPQNHRTFLYLSVESIAHLSPSLSAVYSLYFSLFSLPRPVSAQSPSIPSFCSSFVRLCKSSPLTSSPPRPIHHYSSHLHVVRSFLLSTCFHFLNCPRSIIFTLPSMAIFHLLSFFHSYLMLFGFTSLLSSPCAFPGGLYFTQPAWPQVDIAVLVRACDWVGAAVSSRAPRNGSARGELSLCSKLNFYPWRREDKQRLWRMTNIKKRWRQSHQFSSTNVSSHLLDMSAFLKPWLLSVPYVRLSLSHCDIL